MNKLFAKVTATFVGMAMAICVGVALNKNQIRQAKATAGDTVTFHITPANVNAGGGTYPSSYSTSEVTWSQTVGGVTMSFALANHRTGTGSYSGSLQTRVDNTGNGYVRSTALTSGYAIKSITPVAFTGSNARNWTYYGDTTPITYTSSTNTVTGGTALGEKTNNNACNFGSGSNYNPICYPYTMFLMHRSGSAASYSSEYTIEVVEIEEIPEGTHSVSYNKNTTDDVDNMPEPHFGLEENDVQALVTSPEPTRFGYTFAGWGSSPSSLTPIENNQVVIGNADIVVYAIWQEDHTIPGVYSDNPYTVADAKDYIDTLGASTSPIRYVSGKISQIDSYSDQYHSITYWISDDGTTTDQFEVYSGKGLNGANFSAVGDIVTGADVVIRGNLKKYNDVYEFDMNNYLVSYQPPAGKLLTPSPVFNVANQVFTWAAVENASGYEAKVDDGEFTSVSSPYDVSGFTPGVIHTLTLKAIGDGVSYIDSDSATAKFALINDGTSAEPYSVAEAFLAIDIGAGLSNVYATGIVSQVDNFNNGAITYWISDDGGTQSQQLEAYKGKGIGGAAFASIDDVQVGDAVVILGNLTKYNSTYEFAASNQLYSLTRYSLSFAKSFVDLLIGASKTQEASGDTGGEPITYTSSNNNVATVDPDTGEVTGVSGGEAEITASYTRGVQTYEASYIVHVLSSYSIAHLYDYVLASGSYRNEVTFDGIFMGETNGGLIVMNGEYGMLVYGGINDGYTVGETYLTVSGVLKNYSGLYEIDSGAEIGVLVGAARIAQISAPSTYVVSGTETISNYDIANRKTSLSGTVYSVMPKGQETSTTDGAIGVTSSDNTYMITVGGNQVQLFVKSTVATESVINALAVNSTITVEGFSAFFLNNFQVVFTNIVEADANYEAADFAKDLLKLTSGLCNADYDGIISNHDALASIWTTLAGADYYLKLDATIRNTTLIDTAADSTIVVPDTNQGIDEMDDDDALAAALYRYDYCTAKYNLTHFIENRTLSVNFVHQNIVSVNNNQHTTYLIISIVSVISLSALGAFFFMKKRKEQ